MILFLQAWGSTLLAGGIVLLCLVLAVRHVVRTRKRGGCGCGCAGCTDRKCCGGAPPTHAKTRAAHGKKQKKKTEDRGDT